MKLNLFIFALFNCFIISTVSATIKNDVSKVKTSTIALPSKSKSIWDIPPFKLMGIDGKEHQLEQWKGKVIILNFWASWCAPCQHEIKDFIIYQKKFKNKLQVVSIGLDDKRKLKNVARTLEINYPVLFANLDKKSTRDILEQWGNKEGFIPYSVVIKSNGDIHYIHRGQFTRDSFNMFVYPLLLPSNYKK
ncbi:MAG: TlpA disulfide reductase family protein [Pseudomonadota bacterium]